MPFHRTNRSTQSDTRRTLLCVERLDGRVLTSVGATLELTPTGFDCTESKEVQISYVDGLRTIRQTVATIPHPNNSTVWSDTFSTREGSAAATPLHSPGGVDPLGSKPGATGEGVFGATRIAR